MPGPNESILSSVKKLLLIDESYTVYDPDVLAHINTAIFTLGQLGIGPVGGFMVVDKDQTWGDLLGANLQAYQAVETYVGLKTRMAFDPPGTSYHIAAMEKQIEQLEWRLSVTRDELFSPPVAPTLPSEEFDGVIDGVTLLDIYTNAKES